MEPRRSKCTPPSWLPSSPPSEADAGMGALAGCCRSDAAISSVGPWPAAVWRGILLERLADQAYNDDDAGAMTAHSDSTTRLGQVGAKTRIVARPG